MDEVGMEYLAVRREREERLKRAIEELADMGAFYGPPNNVKENKVFLYGFFEKKIKCTSLDGGKVTRMTIPAESLFEISELDLPKNKITLIHGDKQYPVKLGGDNFLQIVSIETVVPVVTGSLYDVTGAKVGNSYWTTTRPEPGTVGFAMTNIVQRLSQSDWGMTRLTRCKLAFVMLVNEYVCVVSGKRELPLYEEKQEEEE